MPKRHSVHAMREFCKSSLWSEKQWSSSCSVWSKLAPTLCLHGGSCAVFLFSKSLPCPIESNEGIIDLFELTLSPVTQHLHSRTWENGKNTWKSTCLRHHPAPQRGRWEDGDPETVILRSGSTCAGISGSPQSTYVAVHFLGPLYLRQTWNTSINTIPDTKHRCVYNRVIRIDWTTEQTC